MELSKYIDSNYNNIAIFTNFDSLEYSDLRRRNLSLEKEGYTGNWVIAKNRDIEKIVLYVREDGVNKIYLANYTYRENIEGRRYRVYFKNLKFVENTISNWKDFANTQSPIRYISLVPKLQLAGCILDAGITKTFST
jgi:hypothetical protein